MIIVGKAKPKIINVQQIISLELVKGKITAFVKGKLIDGEPVVEDMAVREPWSIIIKTAIDTSYINTGNFESALSMILDLVTRVNPGVDKIKFEGELRNLYGKE
jgi:hypothetical protein